MSHITFARERVASYNHRCRADRITTLAQGVAYRIPAAQVPHGWHQFAIQQTATLFCKRDLFVHSRNGYVAPSGYRRRSSKVIPRSN